ncbi:DUF488 domain-containing protein [uncultured Abiotrophia sp.]|uniref:DUF488 domain-containing protein n=1 Tax=uncultured Abiotrophia sp. TaxID=316094 RepID=UPI002627D0D3|nr:DUF488 domain-containing protein [uncultured Abiotrophia sp.]
MIIYTIGFTKKTAEDFFSKIKKEGVEILIDTRLNNRSQLSGFAKGSDLPYFLRNLSECEYSYEDCYAPTKEILDDYKNKRISWSQYEEKYREMLHSRKAVEVFYEKYGKYKKVVLLCSEHDADFCHRRLLAEEIQNAYGYSVKHI